MTQADMIQVIMATPEVALMTRSVDATGKAVSLFGKAEKQSAVENFLPLVVTKIALRHNWRWAMKVHTIVTVANQADYELKGSSQDARKIKAVIYDTAEDALDFMTLEDYDIRKSRTTNPLTAIAHWIPIDDSINGFPRIKIWGTPGTAGKNIKYRYWRKVAFGELPDAFHSAVFEGVLAMINPGAHFRLFEFEIDRLIADATKIPDGVNVAAQDSHLLKRNIKKNRMFGW